MSTGVYNKTVGDLINEALRAATITGDEMPVEAIDFSIGSTALNDVLAFLQTQGVHIWSETEALMPLNAGQVSYSLGVGGDHAFTDYSYTLASIATAGATSITVDSTAGMTVGDFLGIGLENNTRQWTTISTIVGNVITFPDALSDDVVDRAGVYAYTTKIDQPLRILAARYNGRYSDQTAYFDDFPIRMVSRKEYYDQNYRTATGVVTMAYYSRQLSNGVLNVWPGPDRNDTALSFTFVKPQYVAEDQSENVLVPAEWFLPLKWQVAVELGSLRVIDKERQMMNEAKAERYMQAALSVDVEELPFSIEPEQW